MCLSNSVYSSEYTSQSWSIFKVDLDNAKLVLNNINATQSDVDAAKIALQNTKTALILLEKGDKIGLQDSINRKPLLTEEQYTVDTWKVYKDALDAAMLVNSQIYATQAEIYNSKLNLDKSFNDLKIIIFTKVSELKAYTRYNSIKLTWDESIYSVGLKEYVAYKDGKELTRVKAGTLEYTTEALRENTIYGFKITSVYTNGQESKPVSINVRTTTNSQIRSGIACN